MTNIKQNIETQTQQNNIENKKPWVFERIGNFWKKTMNGIANDFESWNYKSWIWKSLLAWWWLFLWYKLFEKAFKWVEKVKNFLMKDVLWIKEWNEKVVLETLLKWLWLWALVWVVLSLLEKYKYEDALEAAKSASSLAKFLWEKVTWWLTIPKDLLDWIKTTLKEKFNEVWKDVISWLEQLDKEIGFSKWMEEVKKFFSDKWIEIPENIKNLKLGKIKENLNNDEIIEYLKRGWIFLLLAKYFGKKWVMTWALYFLFSSKHLQGEIPEEIEKIQTHLNDAKNNLLNINDKYLKDFIPDFLQEIDFTKTWQDSVLLKIIKESPMLSAWAVTVAWFSRAYIFALLLHAKWWILGLAKVIKNNPLIALSAGWVGYTYRKDIIKKLALILEDENDKQWLYKTANEILQIDVNAPDTFLEWEAKVIIESLIAKPYEGFVEWWKWIETSMEKWLIAFAVDELWALFLLAQGTIIPIALLNLEANQLSFIWKQLIKFNKWEIENISPVMMASWFAVVIWRMTAKSLEAWKIAVIDSSKNENFWVTIRKAFKTVNPLSNEWKFIFRSMWMWIPWADAVFNFFKSGAIWRTQSNLIKIKQLIKDWKYDEAKQLVERSTWILKLKTLSELDEKLPWVINDFRFNTEFSDFNRKLWTISSDIDNIEKAKLAPTIQDQETKKKEALKRIDDTVKNLDDKLRQFGSTGSKLITRYELFMSGEFKKAFNLTQDNLLDHYNQKQMSSAVKAWEYLTEEIRSNNITRWQRIVDLEREIWGMTEYNAEKINKIKELHVLKWFENPNSVPIFDQLHYSQITDNKLKTQYLHEYAAKLEAIDKWANEKMTIVFEELMQKAKQNPNFDITGELNKVQANTINPYAQERFNGIKHLNEWYDNLPKDLQKSHPELKTQIKLAQEWAEWWFLTKLKKWASWKLKMFALMAGIMTWIKVKTHETTDEEDLLEILCSLWPAVAQLFVDLLPVIWTASLLQASVTWENLIDKETKVDSVWDRLMNLSFWVASLAWDILSFGTAWAATPITIWGRIVMLSTKWWRIWKAAKELLKIWPTISKIIDKIWMSKFLETTKSFFSNWRASSVNFLQSTLKYATIWGTAIMIWGIAVPAYYQFIDTWSKDIEETAH